MPIVTDRANFDQLLKDLYIGPVRDCINRATVMLDYVKPKENVQVSGRKFIIPVIKAKNLSITSRSGASKTANQLPTAGVQDYENATYWANYHYGRIEVDGPSMRSSRDDKGAFAQSLDTEINGVTIAMAQDLNRQIFGDGTNSLARCTAANSTTTVTVDSTKHLYVGQLLTFVDEATGLNAALVQEVASITSATVFELDAAPETLAAGDHAVSPDSSATAVGTAPVAGSWMNGLNGIKAIVSNANVTGMSTNYVGNINRSTAGNEFWDANVLGNSGTNRPLSRGLMQQAMLASRKSKFGGKIPDFAVCDADMWATYGNLLVADKRYRGEAMTMDGGWEYLDFSGVKVFWDKDCDANRIYWCSSPNLFFLTQAEIDFMDKDGAILSRVLNYDSYEATLFCDKELGTDNPAAHTLLSDLSNNLN